MYQSGNAKINAAAFYTELTAVYASSHHVIPSQAISAMMRQRLPLPYLIISAILSAAVPPMPAGRPCIPSDFCS